MYISQKYFLFMSLSRWDIINKEYTTQILNPVFVTIESRQKKKWSVATPNIASHVMKIS